jgi:hypothetical protein
MTRCLVIGVEGTISAVQLATLEDFQAAVGGYIKGIAFGPRCFAFVNEDGIRLRLAPNPRATHLWHVLGYDDRQDLVGPVVVVGCVDADGKPTDVPANFLGIE